MTEFDKDNETTLTNDENPDLAEEQLTSDKVGKSRSSNKKGKAGETRNLRRKKEDALEGKEKSNHKESEEERPHGHPDRVERSDASGSETRHSQSLQSGQTTVQFSSGGGVGANAASGLSSLLGLFGSSALLIRAEAGIHINLISQSINFTLRSFIPQGSLVGDKNFNLENKLSNTIVARGGYGSEISNTKYSLDLGMSAKASMSGNLETVISSITRSISTNATEGRDNSNNNPTLIIFNDTRGPISYIPIFNISNLFPNSPEINFAFSNSIQPPDRLIDTYLKLIGLPAAATYTYFNTTLPTGLTLTNTGNLTVDVPRPVSTIINVDNGTTIIPIRIDAGPGILVDDRTSSNYQYNPVSQNVVFVANIQGNPLGTVTRIFGSEIVVGNYANWDGGGGTTLPANVIYRHVVSQTGSDISTVTTPVAPVMGNFETGNITVISPIPYNLGGNVLDVFGTSYGIGQSLEVHFTSIPATLNFNGNTLAGFGTYYGDFKTLSLYAPNPSSSNNSQTIVFGPNELYVDKAVGTTVYPNIENLNLYGNFYNLNITFNNNIIVGSQGSDTFYGELFNINNFNLNDPAFYNDFIKGVTYSTTPAGILTITSADGNNNSITWGNDTYTGKGGPTDASTIIKGDIYRFTLLGDTTGKITDLGYSKAKPIMLGHDTITDFNAQLDTLEFQLTPALLKSLDLNHDKQVSAGELRIPADYDRTDGTKTVINFAGGSLTLIGDNTFNLGNINFSTQTVIPYTAIVAKPLEQVVISPSVLPISLPVSQPPFLYGIGPYDAESNLINPGPYFNELDNFFANSLLATYEISNSNGAAFSIQNGTEYVIAGGLTIDKFGTIDVNNLTPLFIELKIVGTDQQGHAETTTQFFGFLNAPILVIEEGGSTVNKIDFLTTPSNIIVGGANSTLIGGGRNNLTVDSSPANPFGSNLIVGTSGVANAYGDFVNFTVLAQSAGGETRTNESATTGIAILNSDIDFKANAFDINGGNVYGVAQNFNMTAVGGSNNTLSMGDSSALQLTLDDSAKINFSDIEFRTQTFYGYGTYWGNLENLNISVTAGDNAKLSVTTIPDASSSGKIDISGQIDTNTFTFNYVTMVVKDDTSSITTKLYANLENLSITTQPTFSKIIGANYTIDATATFSNNSFVFKGANLKGGVGNTEFYSDINLNANTSPYAYNGFIHPVAVSYENGNLVTTTNDDFNNSIVWGDNTFTGGQGTNKYFFNLLENASGEISVNSTNTMTSNNYAVFTGKDIITNFDVTKDTLIFNIESSLYAKILLNVEKAISYGITTINGLTLDSNVVNAADLGLSYQFGPDVSSTGMIISFNGNGQLTLAGISISSFGDLANRIEIHMIPDQPIIIPVLNQGATFDPVFVNVVQPGAFADFISNANPLNLTYTATELPSGITLSSNGTLTVNVSGPVEGSVIVTATEDNNTETTVDDTNIVIPVHIFAINDSTGPIIYDSTSEPIIGVPRAMAFEVTAGTVYGGGGDITLDLSTLPYGSKLIYNTSTVDHEIYGDVQKISNDPDVNIVGKTFTFDGNILNINFENTLDNQGQIARNDRLYGTGQIIFIDTTTNDRNFNTNTFDIGSKIIYGSGTLYGDFESITLNNINATTTIDGNRFNFSDNKITAGVYLDGNDNLISPIGLTKLYGNVANLNLTGTGNTVNQVKNNIFDFGDATLVGGSGPNDFFGHLQSFGSTFNTNAYGTNGFYYGVTVSYNLTETIMTIKDGNNNQIIWGNNNYTGNSNTDTYQFTIVPDKSSFADINQDNVLDNNPAAVMQGFDTITNYVVGADKLVFQLSGTLYALLDTNHNGILTFAEFSTVLSLAPGANTADAVISFNGGGRITLKGLGQTLTSLDQISSDISVTLADPISAKTPLTSNVMIFGLTHDLNTWTNLFNTTHILSATVKGMTLNLDGTVDFGTNTGIIDANVANVTARDLTNTVTSQGPVQVLALDGILINQTGDLQGNSTTDVNGTGAAVFVGHGNATITGGITALDYSSSSNPGNLIYNSKLIYDGSGQADIIYGDVQIISFTNDGTSTGIANTSSKNISFSENYIQASGTIYGNAENLNLTRSGTTSTLPSGNIITLSDDTLKGIYGPTIFYGDIKNFGNSDNPEAFGSNGFYNGVTVTGTTAITIKDGNNNAITWGNDIYTGSSGIDTYNFTIIGNKDSTSKPIMQGFDTITNFDRTMDKLSFSLAYPVYAALAGSSSLTSAEFINYFFTNNLITQTNTKATITFDGGGSIILNGLGSSTLNLTSLKTALINDTIISVADPITAKIIPTTDVMIFGNTHNLDTWSGLFNTGHILKATIDGITLKLDGTVDFGTNTGIINLAGQSVIASDLATSNVTSTSSVRVLALDGVVIDQAGDLHGDSPTDQYGIGATVFIGHGNAIITGGVTNVDYSSTSNPGNLTYGSKLIYDGSGLADTIYGDTKTISFINDGTADGNANTSSKTITIGENFIQASGTIYGNVADLYLTSTEAGIAQPHDNTFTFKMAELVGGSGNDIFYGHLENFGNSNNPDAYGSSGFYNGVTVTGTTAITIQDGNGNKITWGNNGYTGGAGEDTYNFTIVPDQTNQAVMQGFDNITDFDLATDKLVFKVSYNLYTTLDTNGDGLTFYEFSTVLSLPALDPDIETVDAVISFNGGGNLKLEGLGPTLTDLNQLNPAVSFILADPISAKATLTSDDVMIFGNTADLHAWQDIFNTSHLLSATVNGITLNDNGTVDFGTNLGIIDTSVSSITANDDYTTVTSSGPVHILALDGELINNATGAQQGTADANVFIGYGNDITGAGLAGDIIYTSTAGTNNDNAVITFGDKLIYNDAPLGTGTIIGDITNINLTAQGTTDNVDTSGSDPNIPSNSINANVVNFDPVWIFSNANSETFGNAKIISMNATGGTNIFSAGTASFSETESVSNNAIIGSGNTISASGNAYGMAENITLNATNGFYSAASGSTNQTLISSNTFQAAGNTLTGNNDSSGILYGDLKDVSLTINSPTNTNGNLTEASNFSAAVQAANTTTPGSASIYEGNSLIVYNAFDFDANIVTGGNMGASLFSGIDQLVIKNNEVTLNNVSQTVTSEIAYNQFVFNDSILTASGGLTKFYDEIGDLSQTNFNFYDVDVQYVNGHVIVTDNAGTGLFTANDSTVHDNSITFSNDEMNGSATGSNIFNIDLLSSTTGDIVTEGHTTINNFGMIGTDANQNILHLTLSQALYNNILQTNSNASSLMTGAMLDSYIQLNGSADFSTVGNDTTISFIDDSNTNLGSLIFHDTPFNSFDGLGSNLQITANGTNYYYAEISGNTISSFTNNVQIMDFDGNLNLSMSQSLFNDLGLSDNNTYAENAALLEQSASTKDGGIAVSNVNGNTVLTFESALGQAVTTYGSITLYNATFSVTELQNHLLITHQ